MLYGKSTAFTVPGRLHHKHHKGSCRLVIETHNTYLNHSYTTHCIKCVYPMYPQSCFQWLLNTSQCKLFVSLHRINIYYNPVY